MASQSSNDFIDDSNEEQEVFAGFTIEEVAVMRQEPTTGTRKGLRCRSRNQPTS